MLLLPARIVIPMLTLTAATTVLLLLRLHTATNIYIYIYIYLLKPSERSHTYMGMATNHHLETGPRSQPWWCYSIFRSTQRSHGHPAPLPPYQLGLLQTTTLLLLRTYAVCVNSYTHIYSWPGDHNLTMETSSGFVIYPCGPGKLDRIFADG